MICIANLASYAVHPEASRGRRYAEEADPKRSPFQRDRDRIIHLDALSIKPRFLLIMRVIYSAPG